MSEPEYKITKEDVEKMLRYLRLVLPEHATPEKAIFLLEQQHIHYENIEKLQPELIESILQDFEQN